MYLHNKKPAITAVKYWDTLGARFMKFILTHSNNNERGRPKPKEIVLQQICLRSVLKEVATWYIVFNGGVLTYPDVYKIAKYYHFRDHVNY